MNQEEAALGRVAEVLDRLSIPYMVTGSIATSYHGRPRSTHDADVVIDPTAAALESLLAELQSRGFYVSEDGARRALRQRQQFNVIEIATAAKLDLIVRKDRAFSRTELGRRQRVDLPFAPAVAIVSPEDAILSKLEWARRSGDSERQIQDAAHVVELNADLDRVYIEQWAQQLGVSDLWERIARTPGA